MILLTHLIAAIIGGIIGLLAAALIAVGKDNNNDPELTKVSINYST